MFKNLHFLVLIACATQTNGQVQIMPDIRSIAVLAQFQNSSGSGFYLQDSSKQVYFVTAYHVLFNLSTNRPLEDSLTLISYRRDVENDEQNILQVSVYDALKTGNIKIDKQNDIVTIKVATVQELDTIGNASVHYSPYAVKKTRSSRITSWFTNDIFNFQSVIAGSDIYIIGYPKSLGLQGSFDLDRPLFRKGIVAGKDIKYNRIIGDGAVYFGNSGGAVFGFEYQGPQVSVKLIGIVSQFIPFNDFLYDARGNAKSVDTKNSGYSVIIPAELIIKLLM